MIVLATVCGCLGSSRCGVSGRERRERRSSTGSIRRHVPEAVADCSAAGECKRANICVVMKRGRLSVLYTGKLLETHRDTIKW